MSTVCHILCLFNEENLDIIFSRQFEQTRFRSLPILKSEYKHNDLLTDFKAQYQRHKTNTAKYNQNTTTDEKTGYKRNNNIMPIMENSDYPFIKYLQITRNGVVYMLVYSTAFAESSNMFEDLDCFKAFQYLTSLDGLLKNFFNKTFSVKQLMNNTMLLNEIVDETIDFGIPQLTDYNLLHQYIKLKAEEESAEIKEEKKSTSQLHNLKKLVIGNSSSNIAKSQDSVINPKEDIYLKGKIIETLNDTISWRPKGLHYKKNELFVDVIEKIKFVQDLNIDGPNNIKYHQIEGSILCKSYLSGMPLVKLGLINDMTFNVDRINQKGDEFKFHQCIQQVDTDYYQNKDGNKLVNFVPPDGEFELCNYRFDILNDRKRHDKTEIVQITQFTRSFKAGSVEKLKMPSVKMSLQIKTYFKKNLVPEFLRVKIPLGTFIDDLKSIDLTFTPKFKTDFGTIIFNLSEDFLIWECKNIKGNYGEKLYDCFVQFQLIDEEIMKLKREELKKLMDAPPIRNGPKLEKIHQELQSKNDSNITKIDSLKDNKIQVEFEIPYFVSSGLKIDFIRIEEPDITKYQFFSWIRYKTVSSENGYNFTAAAQDIS